MQGESRRVLRFRSGGELVVNSLLLPGSIAKDTVKGCRKKRDSSMTYSTRNCLRSSSRCTETELYSLLRLNTVDWPHASPRETVASCTTTPSAEVKSVACIAVRAIKRVHEQLTENKRACNDEDKKQGFAVRVWDCAHKAANNQPPFGRPQYSRSFRSHRQQRPYI